MRIIGSDTNIPSSLFLSIFFAGKITLFQRLIHCENMLLLFCEFDLHVSERHTLIFVNFSIIVLCCEKYVDFIRS